MKYNNTHFAAPVLVIGLLVVFGIAWVNGGGTTVEEEAVPLSGETGSIVVGIKSADASSTANDLLNANYLIDRNESTDWASEPWGDEPVIIELKLDGVNMFNRLYIEGFNGWLTSFDVEYMNSEKGDEWVQIYGGAKIPVDAPISFGTVEGDRLRITMNREVDTQVLISEVGVRFLLQK